MLTPTCVPNLSVNRVNSFPPSKDVRARQQVLKPITLPRQRVHVQLQLLGIEIFGRMFNRADEPIVPIEGKGDKLVLRIALPRQSREPTPSLVTLRDGS